MTDVTSELGGQQVCLRPFAAQHLDKSRAWFNDPELARLLDRSKTVSEEEHRKWFASLADRDDIAYFAIETVDGTHIGNVWLAEIDQRNSKAELRIAIGEQSHTSRGAGSEAMRLLCKYAFKQLGLHKVYAYVLAINPRAVRSFEKAGFSIEGTLRQDRKFDTDFTDVFLLGILANESNPTN